MFDLDALQIYRVHHRALKEFYRSEVSLYETFEFQIWRFPVQENDLNINIFPIFMEKIFEEMADTLVSDMAADNNMSAR